MSQLGSSTISNLWLGHSVIEFDRVEEKGELDLAGAGTYLSNIEYIVDIHVPRSELANVVSNNVGVMYTTSGDDFASEDRADRGNVRVFQELKGYSLDFEAEKLGRYEATLRGTKFISQVNAGADPITLTGNSAKLLAGTAVADPITVPFGTINKTANVQCSAIPRAISAQMQGFASDENLLRLVASADSYNNLLTFPLSGAKDSANGDRAMHKELRGADLTTANNFAGTVKDILESPALSTVNKPISGVSPGHLIVAAMFNAHPPRADNSTTTNVHYNNINMLDTGDEKDRLWKRVNQVDAVGDGKTDIGDFLVLNNTTDITEEIVLQYVLKTKMTLIARDSITQLNSTMKSPNTSEAAANEVHILYNIRFDH